MKQLDLGNEKIGKLLLSFSIPCVISMLINSVYNIVDQIFIGKGVGTIGNAATNVIFPFVIFCNAVAGLIGNGSAANLSLRLGEGKKEESRKSVGSSITLLILVSLVVALLGELFLPWLLYAFGCTKNVYSAALSYGRIILLGVPFMIIYSGMSSIIRADGAPTYSMICLVVGAIINLILDPIFIFSFHLGVKGGALATIIGQAVSFLFTIFYLNKFKTIALRKEDFKLNRSILKTLSLGLSSFITQITILALFVVMNNIMTIYGASSRFGSDVPLSVYGVISKINSLYVSSVLGIAIGAQPIIGFNYGAGNYERVKETLKKLMIVAFLIGLFFNIMFVFFPELVISIFIRKSDPNYKLFMEFAIDYSKIFLLVCSLNAFEMTSSIVIQSLGKVKKATLVSFTRQIILFIPLALLLSHFIGLYGAIYAGPIADFLCFLVVIFIFGSEYRSLSGRKDVKEVEWIKEQKREVPRTSYVITIAREYGSGGHYIGELLAKELHIPCYDRELIHLASIKSGFTPTYIEEKEETRNSYYENDNAIFIAESSVIKEISKDPCIIIGRCGNAVLEKKKNLYRIFLYSSEEDKINRVTKYYHVPKNKAKEVIEKKNRERAKYYQYYTDKKWNDINNYDIMIQVDVLGIEKTVELLKTILQTKKD